MLYREVSIHRPEASRAKNSPKVSARRASCRFGEMSMSTISATLPSRTAGSRENTRRNLTTAAPRVQASRILGRLPKATMRGTAVSETSMTSSGTRAVSYTHLRAHETDSYLVCRLLLDKKKKKLLRL